MLYHQIIQATSSDEWIVFIHGAGGSSNVWFRQVRTFACRYNLLLIDLRGHGLSVIKNQSYPSGSDPIENYTFRKLAADVIEVLDALSLKNCHFIGLSLGTIIIREIAEHDRAYVRSMVLAGAILKLNKRIRLLSRAANLCKRIVPYMVLYKFYAHLIMPRPAQQTSRQLFIENALRITHNEFLNWMTLNRNLDQLLRIYSAETSVPTLYVMGENDYVFLSQVRIQLHESHRNSYLHIIPGAGHVCNIDRSDAFNAVTQSFLEDCAAL